MQYRTLGRSGLRIAPLGFIERIHRLLDAGFGEQLLLSHDRGWYDPSKPNGGAQLPYTYLCEVFLPKLRASGVDEATVQ